MSNVKENSIFFQITAIIFLMDLFDYCNNLDLIKENINLKNNNSVISYNIHLRIIILRSLNYTEVPHYLKYILRNIYHKPTCTNIHKPLHR